MDRLFPLVYDELRNKAHAQRAGAAGLATMNTTAIVHEAYLKLADQKDARYENRLHFYAVAAKAMRHVFLDYAKRKKAIKRGGGIAHVSFDETVATDASLAMTDDQADEVIALDRVLTEFSDRFPRQSRVLECRFFGGMTIDDTAAVLQTSPATVKRDWAFAQAWLYRALHGSD
jgi:RNA polymerase sigma factor (TIGR02999 family)